MNQNVPPPSLRATVSSDSLLTDDSLALSTPTQTSGLSRFSKWVRGAQPGGCALQPHAGEMAVAPKSALKSRVCAVYERVFEGRDPDDDSFSTAPFSWDEFWLLKVDMSHLRDCLAVLTEAELLAHNRSLRNFLHQAKKAVCADSNSRTRKTRALQTLSAVLWGVLSKSAWGGDSFSGGVLKVVCGVEAAPIFFGDLIKAAVAAVAEPQDGRRDKEDLEAAATEFLRAVVCGQKNCSKNALIELPARQLVPPQSFFFDVSFSRCADHMSEPPKPVLSSLAVLGVLLDYEREELPDRKVSEYLRSLRGVPLLGLLNACTWILHTFSKGFVGWARVHAKQQGSFLESAVSYFTEASPPTAPPPYDPSVSHYQPAPGPVCAVVLVLAELSSGNEGFVEHLTGRETHIRSQFEHVECARNSSKANTPGAPLFYELVFATSILLQSNKHRTLPETVRGLLLMWCRLLAHQRLISFVHSGVPELKQPLAMKRGTHWRFEFPPDCRIKGAPPDQAQSPVVALLCVAEAYISVNLVSNFSTEGFELAITLVNSILFYQLESKVKVDWNLDHFAEKVFQVLGLMTKTNVVALDTPPGARLFKKLCILIRLVLRHPTLLFSPEQRIRFVYELVRSKATLLSIEKFVRNNLLQGRSSRMSSLSTALLNDSVGLIQELISLVDRIEIGLDSEVPAADKQHALHCISQVLDSEESHPKHDGLWKLPPVLYEELSMPKRDLNRHLSQLRNLVADLADPFLHQF